MEAGQKIVVVDDDEPALAEAMRTLSAAGYRVVTTSDPASAAALIRRESPQLVLSEIFPSKSGGYVVLDDLRADPAGAPVSVVFLTAHREFDERVKAFRAGVVDYITKPYAPEVLLRKVERLLSDRDRRTAAVQTIPPQAAPAAAPRPEPGVPVRKRPTAEVATLPGEVHGVPPAADNKRLLVVDDHPQLRLFLTRMLSVHGFTVDEAADGVEALERIRAARPAIVLTDVLMPRMDGYELCRKIRESPDTRSLPVVFLSGVDELEDRARALSLGADEFLSKQTPARELVMRLRLLLDRARSAERALRGAGLAGHIESVGASGALQFCHWGRLTGTLRAERDDQTAEIRFRRGDIVAARVGSATREAAVFEFLGWDRGAFEFLPGDAGQGAPLGESFSHLLIEGTRLLDERRRARESED